MKYVVDGSARRIDDGRVLLGGSPLTLFRLSERGAAVLDRIVAGETVSDGDAVSRFVGRLVDAGVLHPVPGPSRWTADDVTVVIPVHGEPTSTLDALLAGLGPVHEVVVVDDASDPALTLPELDETCPPVRLVSRRVNGGPAAARNTGLAEVGTPVVAFVDADALPDSGWLAPLLGHLDDASVVAAAPRIRTLTTTGNGVLARYEATRSPLDLGPVPGRVRARTRISYVPAAALVARTDVVRALGGFDEAMRVGEDVDLVWRLVEAGHRVRYEPAATVAHRPRPTLRAWLAQRASYGRSAGSLAKRHTGALAPVAVSAWSAGAWSLTAARLPATGVAVGAGSALALSGKLAGLRQPVREALRIAGFGHLHAGRQLAAAVTRAWWPIALAAALVSRRARRAVVAAAVVPAVIDWWEEAGRSQQGLPPALYVGLRIVDDAAYGAGLWLGAIKARTADPLVPDLTSWPRPSRYDRTHSR